MQTRFYRSSLIEESYHRDSSNERSKSFKVLKANELNSVQTLISSRNRNLAKSFNLENHFVQTLHVKDYTLQYSKCSEIPETRKDNTSP